MVQPRQAVAAGVVALALGGLALALWSNWDGVQALGWREGGAAGLGAVALFAIAPLLQAVCFRIALRHLGASAPWLPTAAVWTRSFLLRYAPTGALGYVYRVRRKERLGADAELVVKATALEQLAAVVAGAVVGLGAFASAGLAGAVFAKGRLQARLVGVNLVGWLPTTLGAWLLLSELAPDAQIAPVRLAGAYAVAWLAGFLVPFAPGGLGIREAVLASFLVEPLGAGDAVTLALAIRLASVLGELLAFAAVEGAYRAATPR